MKESHLLVVAASLLLAGARVALAQDVPESVPAEFDSGVSEEPAKTCFPPCRTGYVCHPNTLECVSNCNPPCANWETCTAEAECAPNSAAPARVRRESGDRRFRIALLGRFGLGGKSVVKIDGSVFSGSDEFETKPGATLGFDVRFEKPVARFVTVGGLVSNYWFRSERDPNATSRIRNLNQKDYALDVAPFVKPRYPFKAGKNEAEAYVIINIGGSLRVLEISDGTFLMPKSGVFGGFNWGVAPGFQIFLAEHIGLVFEVGYARSWFKIGSSLLKNIKVGQATLRFGFTVPF